MLCVLEATAVQNGDSVVLVLHGAVMVVNQLSVHAHLQHLPPVILQQILRRALQTLQLAHQILQLDLQTQELA